VLVEGRQTERKRDKTYRLLTPPITVGTLVPVTLLPFGIAVLVLDMEFTLFERNHCSRTPLRLAILDNFNFYKAQLRRLHHRL
jgi:hypothetical protein